MRKAFIACASLELTRKRGKGIIRIEVTRNRDEIVAANAAGTINAAASPAVAADPALTALAEQSRFAISQHVLGQYWTPAEAFGAELEAHSEGDLQRMLDQLVEQATAK